MKKSIILIFAFLLSLSSYSQSQLSQEDAFIYFMKTNNHKKGDNIQNNKRGFGNFKWFDVYVQSFMQYEYKTAINNEFKMQKFTNDANNRIDQKLKTLSFSEEYTLYTTATLGKYDFNKGVFPIYFDIENIEDIARDLEGLFIGIGSIINKDDINFSIKMSSDKAESLMSSLQQSNGVTNRKLNLVMTYNITKLKPNDKGSNGYKNTDLNIYVSSIKVTTDGGASVQIASIVPRQWDDRVNGRKSNNGIARYENGDYYTVVEHNNGKIVNPTKQYYKNGKLYSEVYYLYYNNPKDYKVVDFSYVTWFYETGSVYVTAMFRDNLFYRDRVEYYESGKIKDITFYRDGKKDGCSKQYNEDGSCNFPGIAFEEGRFWPSFKMGKQNYRDNSCACDEPKTNYVHPSMLSNNNIQKTANISSTSTSTSTKIIPFALLDNQPTINNCNEPNCFGSELSNLIKKSIPKNRYIEFGISNPKRINLNFVIEKDGTFSNILVYGALKDFKEHIIQQLQSIKVTSVGIKDSKPVKTIFSMPITF